MVQICYRKISGILAAIMANVECSLFNDPLAPRLYQNQVVRYIDLPATAKQTQNITIRLDIPSLVEKTARIKLLLDSAVWGIPVNVQLSMNHTQPSLNCSQLDCVTTFVHNVAIVDYLARIGSRPSENVSSVLEENLRSVLQYRRQDGSFGTPLVSRVYLTAFIAKGLQVAKRYIFIYEAILGDALKWLAAKQQPSGQFVEVEPTLYEKMRDLRLTAYVLTTFATENQYPEVVRKATEYVADRTEQMDVYELALASHALSLANHPKGKYCLEQLNHPRTPGYQPNAYWRGKSSSAEIAGYALLASLNHTVYTNTEDIVQWLKSRSFRSYGGFRHTQGITTALKALSQHYEKFSQHINSYTVQLRYQSNIKILHVTPTNSRMFELDLPSNTKLVQAQVQGTGFGRLEISYQYHQKLSGMEASFALNVQLLNNTTREIQNLQVCVGSRINRTEGLTLVEVFHPKGFSGVSVEDLSSKKSIWKSLQRPGGTSTVVYYQSLARAMDCFVVTAELFRAGFAKSNGGQARQMDVVAYDYYNRDRVAWVSYKGFGRQGSEDDYEYLEAV